MFIMVMMYLANASTIILEKQNRVPIFQVFLHISNDQITYVQLILEMLKIFIQFSQKDLVKKKNQRECFDIFCNLHLDQLNFI